MVDKIICFWFMMSLPNVFTRARHVCVCILCWAYINRKNVWPNQMSGWEKESAHTATHTTASEIQIGEMTLGHQINVKASRARQPWDLIKFSFSSAYFSLSFALYLPTKHAYMCVCVCRFFSFYCSLLLLLSLTFRSAYDSSTFSLKFVIFFLLLLLSL